MKREMKTVKGLTGEEGGRSIQMEREGQITLSLREPYYIIFNIYLKSEREREGGSFLCSIALFKEVKPFGLTILCTRTGLKKLQLGTKYSL